MRLQNSIRINFGPLLMNFSIPNPLRLRNFGKSDTWNVWRNSSIKGTWTDQSFCLVFSGKPRKAPSSTEPINEGLSLDFRTDDWFKFNLKTLLMLFWRFWMDSGSCRRSTLSILSYSMKHFLFSTLDGTLSRLQKPSISTEFDPNMNLVSLQTNQEA